MNATTLQNSLFASNASAVEQVRSSSLFVNSA